MPRIFKPAEAPHVHTGAVEAQGIAHVLWDVSTTVYLDFHVRQRQAHVSAVDAVLLVWRTQHRFKIREMDDNRARHSISPVCLSVNFITRFAVVFSPDFSMYVVIKPIFVYPP